MILEKIEKLGPIKLTETNIELAPLTIFMGDNSAGKTIVSSLFFHQIKIIHYISEVFEKIDTLKNDILNLGFAKKLKKDFEKRIKTEKPKNTNYEFIVEELDESDIKELLEIQRSSMNAFVRMIIKEDYESIFDKKTTVQFSYDFNFEYENKIDLIFDNEIIKIKIFETTYDIKAENNEKIFERVILSWYKEFIKALYKKEFYSQLAYIPAARTGLIKSYNTLLEQSLKKGSIPSSNNNFDFTMAEKTFVTQLLSKQRTSTNKIVDFIEDTIINGKINLENDDSNFELLIKNKKISSKLFSSTLTEILPLIIFLKKGYIKKGSFLVIEEPEAHLSFKNQEIMASVLIKLIKMGTKVLITTHSEYLVYSINNLIKLDTARKKIEKIDKKNFLKEQKNILKKLEKKISNREFISHKKVNVYNFRIDKKNKSIIDKVDVDKNGIHNGYLNDLNFALLDENKMLLEIMD